LSGERLDAISETTIPGFSLPEGFEIGLVAAEPLISDPVAMEIDELGRWYVVEMHGYPLDVSGSGVIKCLEDTDQDGLPDRSSIFADSLILPTGIMRWKDGFIITDAPHVWYIEDTDGDGKADHREVMLTGFARSNPQHNMNSPVYGLDNGIYLANEYVISTQAHEDIFGDEGTEIFFPSKPDGPRLPQNAYDRNVRFRPDTYELAMMSSRSQFGHTFDPWGNYFQTSNASHLHHEVIRAPYLARNPDLLIADAMQYMPNYGTSVEVYPTTHQPQHQLLTDIGTITSACGITWYQGGTFPRTYNDVIFTAEPVHNLIHADRIYPDGATFSAARLWEDREFLASTDARFRPVNCYIGPDGALYVIDYYRKIIEHPEWMADSVKSSDELYAGSNKGRIYRITFERETESYQTEQVKLDTSKWDGLAEPYLPGEMLIDANDWKSLGILLGHDNIWWRRNAQRLLVDKASAGNIPEEILENLVKFWHNTSDPLAKVHVMWAIEGMGLADTSIWHLALSDEHAEVRKNVIQILERDTARLQKYVDAISHLVNDEDPAVRFQLLCTLGSLPETYKLREDLVLQDLEDPWISLAALTGLNMDEGRLMTNALANMGDDYTEGKALFLQRLIAVMGLRSSWDEIEDWVISISRGMPNVVWQRVAILEGLKTGLTYRDNLSELSEYATKELVNACLHPNDKLRDANRSVLQLLVGRSEIESTRWRQFANTLNLERSSQSNALYADYLRLLAVLNPDPNASIFQNTLSPQKPLQIQLAAVEGLGNLSQNRGCTFLLANWQQITPGVRDAAIEPFMKTAERMQMLLTAVENGVVDPTSIGWRRTVRLLNNDDDEIKSYARAVLNKRDEDRAVVVEQYRAAAENIGNANKGKQIFQNNCGICHTYEGKLGVDFGPDLASIRNRPPLAILKDIIMPDRSLADGYEIWEATVTNGEKYVGIISSETPTTLTLKSADLQTRTLRRSDIQQLEVQAYSAMPSGLETQISIEEMSDLLAFIRGF